MTELQFPTTKGSERALLNEYLDWYRAAILRKIEGASDETLRARIVPSQTTLLGIVKHLARVEVSWFQIVFAGREVDDPSTDDDPDADWRIEAQETTEQIIVSCRDACAESHAIVHATENLDAESVGGGKKYNLRRILTT